jgi:hypothetical protein
MLDDTTTRIGPDDDDGASAAHAAGAAPCGVAGAPSGVAGERGVLIASTTWWAFPARLAAAGAARGLPVHAICGPDHPLAKIRSVRGIFPYAALRPLAALERAIRASQAAVVLPCDDRARLHLHRLHGATRDPAIRAVIETSLGEPRHFPVAERRFALIEAARDAGIDAPETVPVGDARRLDAALDRIGLPAVLKVDGTWGGYGIAVVRSRAEAASAFARFARPLSAVRAVKRLLADRDAFDLPQFLSGEMPRLSLQRYVQGRPANSLSICRGGRVLRTICAESLLMQRTRGAAAVVRVIDHAGMREAAETLARRLEISGFLGLDFMLDRVSGAASLVEMNARGTPLAHLCFGAESDLVGGVAELAGCAVAGPRLRAAPHGIVAYFPQAWHTAPHSPYLSQGLHDVPWEEPALVTELLRLPRPDRGILARGLRRLRAPAENRRAASAQARWDMA